MTRPATLFNRVYRYQHWSSADLLKALNESLGSIPLMAVMAMVIAVALGMVLGLMRVQSCIRFLYLY
jgi:hypothetical protein